jgi:branched-subunit amino acid ABC-type transport system permease component
MMVASTGTWLAGLAGTTISPVTRVFPGLADHIWMAAVVAVFVGGLGRLAAELMLVFGFGVITLNLEAKTKKEKILTITPFSFC